MWSLYLNSCAYIRYAWLRLLADTIFWIADFGCAVIITLHWFLSISYDKTINGSSELIFKRKQQMAVC